MLRRWGVLQDNLVLSTELLRLVFVVNITLFCTNFNSAMVMLTKNQKCIFLSATIIFKDTARIRMTMSFWISMPDSPDAIYMFTITAGGKNFTVLTSM